MRKEGPSAQKVGKVQRWCACVWYNRIVNELFLTVTVVDVLHLPSPRKASTKSVIITYGFPSFHYKTSLEHIVDAYAIAS